MIFCTRFECSFSSSPLVSSVVSTALALQLAARFDPPKASKQRSYQEKPTTENYTRNEWRRCKTTLETGGEDVKLHSRRVKKM